jgi:deoxyribodipyrimidine photo-lyase
MMNPKRLRVLKEAEAEKGSVAYWMSRDQRVQDNWALLYAQECAVAQKEPLVVVFCLAPSFLGATIRQYSFMLKGLQEVEKNLERINVPFYLLDGHPENAIPDFLKKYGIKTLITDFDPLRIKMSWKQGVAENIDIPFYEVDAHNVVPCRSASGKQEYGAYTIRPKIKRLLREFMDDFPVLKRHPFLWRNNVKKIDWERVQKGLDIDRSVKCIDWIMPGEDAARKILGDFLAGRIHLYNELRNDPNKDDVSNLSAYLHFGHISAQRVVLEIEKIGIGRSESVVAFMEELVVRKELSDNYCFYNQSYDNVEGLPDWAQKTMDKHRLDRRDYIYSIDDFECGRTHDELWNAAQTEMVVKGKMHGFMRMYWAKKILEWTKSPEDAYKTAIYLNDKYELDGRDPNGYTGIAWSIGGLHDRAWNERNVFGKIRYMSYNGCKAKFRIKEYIEHVRSIVPIPQQ